MDGQTYDGWKKGWFKNLTLIPIVNQFWIQFFERKKSTTNADTFAPGIARTLSHEITIECGPNYISF